MSKENKKYFKKLKKLKKEIKKIVKNDKKYFKKLKKLKKEIKKIFKKYQIHTNYKGFKEIVEKPLEQQDCESAGPTEPKASRYLR